jgi:hypothetical protein
VENIRETTATAPSKEKIRRRLKCIEDPPVDRLSVGGHSA